MAFRNVRKKSRLLYCNDEGTVNDLWKYERGGKTVSMTARGWLVNNG